MKLRGKIHEIERANSLSQRDISNTYLLNCRLEISMGHHRGLRGCLHLEAKGWSPKKCTDVIAGNKWYPTFVYTLGLGPLFFQWMKCLCGILGGNFE
jgi:hypothetical protein